MSRWMNARLVVSLLLLLGLACGCGLLKGTPKYVLDVHGESPDAVQSLFVIVAPDDKLGNANNEREVEGMIHPDKLADYPVFAQYQPREGEPWTWEKVSFKNDLPMLKITPSEEGADITVTIEKELLESYPTLAVVMAAYGRDSWFAIKIQQPEMVSTKELTLDVKASALVRRPGE